jgi:hypothetical protein
MTCDCHIPLWCQGCVAMLLPVRTKAANS